jgi:hypothetical protein
MDSSRYKHRINSFYALFISDNNYHFLGILYEVKNAYVEIMSVPVPSVHTFVIQYLELNHVTFSLHSTEKLFRKSCQEDMSFVKIV